MPRSLLFAAVLLLATFASSLTAAEPPATQPVSGGGGGPAETVKLDDLVNTFRLTDRIYSGSKPESDAAFAALEKLGIKTILCVDGMTPDVAGAKRHGMRYVHIPVGYDGIDRDEGLQIARAVRDLPGPVYVHCHHGLIRGPAAAATAAMCDAGWSNARGLSFLEQVGTDHHYKGIFASVKDLPPTTKEQLDKADNTFPEVAKLERLVAAMVKVDHYMDRIKAAKKAGWKSPEGKPDIDPPHDALQLHELFTEIGRLDQVKEEPNDFKQWLSNATGAAGQLETALRDQKPDDADKAMKMLGQNCGACHDAYRDGAK